LILYSVRLWLDGGEDDKRRWRPTGNENVGADLLMAAPSIYRQTVMFGILNTSFVNVTKTIQTILPGAYLNTTVPKMQVSVTVIVA
jgi:hypothetical protein